MASFKKGTNAIGKKLQSNKGGIGLINTIYYINRALLEFNRYALYVDHLITLG